LEKRRRISLIGIIGLTILFSTLIGYNLLRNTPMLSADNIYYAEFKRVSSLKNNAYVYFNGYEVGRVKDIRLKQDNPNIIVVTFSARKNIRIPADAIAESYVPNPMYEATIHLRYTPLDRAYTDDDFLEEGDVIPGRIGSYLKDFQKIIDPFAIAADSVIMELFPNKDSVQQLFKDTEAAIGRLASTSKSYRKATYDNKTPIIELMLDLRDYSKKIDAQEDSINIMIANLAKQTESYAQMDLKKSIPQIDANKIKLPDIDSITNTIAIYRQKVEAINNNQDSTYSWLVHDKAYKDSLLLKIDNLETTLKQVRMHPERFVSMRKKK
jgi:phospholipid/cholesterol/gamma-HCH transport system substrate-binding protein